MPQHKAIIDGPLQARVEDIPEINAVFSDSFTDRYRRDGLVGVRVPHLNERVWRYAIDDAADGAMTWRDGTGKLAAFSMVHRSGGEGWMGPLAVRPDLQGSGLGKRIVQAGIDWLRQGGASVIGLETMPRTVENIGFYSRLGFLPQPLTVTLMRGAVSGSGPRSALLSEESDATAAIAECRLLTQGLGVAADYTRELQLTARLGLGDASLIRSGPTLRGFALWHSVSLAEGRSAEELRVLKLAAIDVEALRLTIDGLLVEATRLGLERVAVRCQTAYEEAYGLLIEAGFHVQWTDLRMTLAGFGEPALRQGLVLSNWEI